MKSSVETVNPTRVKLAVEVPFEELKPNLDAVYRQFGAQMRVPGFRPGKVPARVIDQRVGRGAVIEQAVNDMLPQLYAQALRDNNVSPLGNPDIELTDLGDMEPGSSLTFSAEVDVRPQFTLPNVYGLPVTVPAAEVTDADVDEQVDALRARFGTLTGVERAVEDGDYVSLDLATSVDRDAIEEGSATGLSYQVGSGDLVDGLDEAILGANAGDTATFTTTLRHGEHAGTEAEVTATVNSVKVRELPEADDEFAQLASEFDTIDELRADLRERLGRTRLLEQGGAARDAVLAKLVEVVPFDVPQGAIDTQVEQQEHDIVHSLGHDDTLFERYLSMQGKTREEFREELATSAEQSVRAQLILDQVADAHDVQVGDAELTEFLVRQARRYDMAPKEFADQIMQAGNLPALVGDVRRNKALAGVIEAATVTDANGAPVDLSALAPSLINDDDDGE